MAIQCSESAPDQNKLSLRQQLPHPHQQEATEAIINALTTCDRTHIVMACGTGKTRVGLWVAEKLLTLNPTEPKRIVIFLPSLALINQTLHEWLECTSWKKISYLVVCSDQTVAHGVEAETLDLEQYTFPVTTTSSEVRKFLSRKWLGISLVFCTYQSSRVLAAGMLHTKSFDLGLFDEGHRTTGIEGREFSLGISDSNIRIKKRLFMTATPRHYKIHSRKKKQEERLVYSMDNVKLYGPRAYTLSFRAAINKGLISDYQIIISTIIHNNKLETLNLNKWDKKSIALKKAVKLCKAKRIITFHKNILDAKQFSDNITIKRYMPDFIKLHINSFMPMARRVNILNLFKNHKKAFISNARCLTEGTNVPAVDMIAFLSPKRSKIDIVQAIGRVLRTSPGKSKGYIFLPLFVRPEQGESIENALERTEYGDIWEVLLALSEQDEDLRYTINYLIQQKEVQHSIEPAGLEKYIKIDNSNIDKAITRKLNEAIFVSILDKIGTPWDKMYAKLCKFYAKYHHCLVSQSNCKNKTLIKWVERQRTEYKKGNLLSEKIQRLEKLNFIWYTHKTQWDMNLNKLKLFKDHYKHCNVPQKYKSDPKLGIWVIRQRTFYKKGKLSKDQSESLNSLGFDWDPDETRWKTMFNKLVEFKKRNNNINIPIKEKELHKWTSKQRKNFKKHKLSKAKIDALNSLGFEWNLIERKWNIMFDRLCQFEKSNGHSNVPTEYRDDIKLSYWVFNQKYLYKKGRLSKNKIQDLNALNFDWNIIESHWKAMFGKLKSFWKENGHSSIPRRYKKLSAWTARQRRNYNIKKLSKEKIELLNSLSFDWYPEETQWKTTFNKLIEFKKNHGHFSVRQKHDSDLYAWIQRQKNNFRKKKMSSERIQQLNSIQFNWKL